MIDLVLLVGWIAVLATGLGACLVLHRRFGVPRTYVRDLLHVGAGLWVFGWPYWHHAIVPIALAAAVALALALVPLLARRAAVAARLRDALSGAGERWQGLVRYALAFAILTAAALLDPHRPRQAIAAAALLALALGDGVGGLIGRRFGRLRYRAPGGQHKTLEGSLTVAVAGAIGIVLASWWFGAPIPAATIVLAALVAALAEALAPRATDNLAVPAAVWAFLRLALALQ